MFFIHIFIHDMPGNICTSITLQWGNQYESTEPPKVQISAIS